MVRHVILWNLKEEFSDEKKQEIKNEINSDGGRSRTYSVS